MSKLCDLLQAEAEAAPRIRVTCAGLAGLLGDGPLEFELPSETLDDSLEYEAARKEGKELAVLRLIITRARLLDGARLFDDGEEVRVLNALAHRGYALVDAVGEAMEAHDQRMAEDAKKNSSAADCTPPPLSLPEPSGSACANSGNSHRATPG